MTGAAAEDASDPTAVRSQAFQMAVSGQQSGVLSFLTKLNQFPSTLNVSALQLSVAADGKVTATFTLKAFYLRAAVLDPQPEAAAGQPTPGDQPDTNGQPTPNQQGGLQPSPGATSTP